MKKLSVLLLSALLLGGCETHITDLSVISNKNVELGKVNLDKAIVTKDVTGEDSHFIFLFIPFGTPKLEEALNDALRKTDGDLMIDASVYQKGWWFIVGQESIEIRGTAVKTRSKK